MILMAIALSRLCTREMTRLAIRATFWDDIDMMSMGSTSKSDFNKLHHDVAYRKVGDMQVHVSFATSLNDGLPSQNGVAGSR